MKKIAFIKIGEFIFYQKDLIEYAKNSIRCYQKGTARVMSNGSFSFTSLENFKDYGPVYSILRIYFTDSPKKPPLFIMPEVGDKLIKSFLKQTLELEDIYWSVAFDALFAIIQQEIGICDFCENYLEFVCREKLKHFENDSAKMNALRDAIFFLVRQVASQVAAIYGHTDYSVCHFLNPIFYEVDCFLGEIREIGDISHPSKITET